MCTRDAFGISRVAVAQDFPPIPGIVRATTLVTAYWLRPTADRKGVEFEFVSHTDPGGELPYLYRTPDATVPLGSLPAWVVNRVAKTMAPGSLDRLINAARAYPEWKKKNRPDHVPWKNATQLVSGHHLLFFIVLTGGIEEGGSVEVHRC